MLEKFRSLFRKRDTPPPEDTSFRRLNELAPLRSAETTTEGDHSFVCREPILNRAGRIAGYEFLLHQRINSRLAGRSATIRRAYDEALILNLSSVGVGSLLEHRFAFVGMSPFSLSSPQLARLPSTNTVLMLELPEEDSSLDAGLLDQVRLAKEQGFHIGYRARPEGMQEELLMLCDFVRISTPTYDGLQLADWMRHLRKMGDDGGRPPFALIAADIETTDDFQICFRAGFDYFHGPFVTRREDWHPPRSQIDSTRVMQILSQLRSEVEVPILAENIRQDAILTYKLLRYINSAANGLQQEITSIDHGLVLLGRERFYRWLSLLLFDVQKAGPLERVLIEQALVRAGLMERLGHRIEGLRSRTDHLFLTGLFSLLDQLLGSPLERILVDVALPEPVVQALISDAGPLAPCLRLAVACESGDQEQMAAGAAACGVDPAAVNQDLVAALVWANSVGEVQG
ncbi:MAG TPA: HDOD domain-containing protein [Rhodocyclaceae bacterium]|nr:HDOD domain-containing protein [Rhodocyclaceae bacterium]